MRTTVQHLLASRTFSAHETQRLCSLEGMPLASFWQRALALVVDLLLFNAFIAAASFGWTALHPVPASAGMFMVVDLHTWWALLLVVAYFGVATYIGNGSTPGKRLLRIRVVSLINERMGLWHSIERALGYAASALEAGFGFLQYFIHPNRQTVHDRIAETIVISERAAAQKK